MAVSQCEHSADNTRFRCACCFNFNFNFNFTHHANATLRAARACACFLIGLTRARLALPTSHAITRGFRCVGGAATLLNPSIRHGLYGSHSSEWRESPAISRYLPLVEYSLRTLLD